MAAPEAGAGEVLDSSRVKGGLCVVLGSGDGVLAARIAEQGSFIVHGLEPDESKVALSRKMLISKGLYGKVSVEHWREARLPYADNLVSVMVVVAPGEVPGSEMLRVLRGDGELFVRSGGRWRRTVKPRPAGMDDWTHWRHGPDRNAVSNDILVDVPGRIQWLFSRSAVGERAHLVCAKGRYFAQDRGLLIARDAFNGLPLWKVRLKRATDFRWEYRVKVAALIVAKDERVYCLTDDGKFKAVDAATGKPVKVYENAGIPYVVLLVDGAGSGPDTLVLGGKDSVRALDAESGKLLWKHPADQPHNVIACAYGVFYIEGNDRRGAANARVSGRELSTGRLMWRKDYYWARRTELGTFGYDRIVYEMRMPHNWREFYASRPEEHKKDRRYQMVVISARTGREIQRIMRTGTSARHGEFRRAFWYRKHLLTEAWSPQGLSLAMFALDDLSKPAVMFKANYVGDRGFGHCHPPVLTARFYLNGQLNFTNLETREQVSNQITRGACNTSRAGYIPANGMIYTFPKHCLCFPMLEGNVALAPAYKDPPREDMELIKGPAWPAKPVEADYSADWPAFRRDQHRSGGTDVTVPAHLKALWTAQIKGPDYKDPLASEWLDSPYSSGSITAPVIADGLVYVAQSDTHRLIALDEKTGERKWEFIANGRLDGPPTIHRGMCLIGCRSGWVYCLRAGDGRLVWKLRIAPYDRRISAYGQLESPWPVHGSVLVADGLAYVAAGIHPNADGGICVVCLRPETGQIVWRNRFSDLGFADPWPDPYEPRKTRPDSNRWRTIRPMEYRYHELAVRDGNSVAVSRCLFDLKTGQVDLRKTSGFYHVKRAGVYMPRTAWRYGNGRIESPPAVFRGRSVFATVPGMSKLFRVDFEKSKPFNTDWVRVSEEDAKARLRHSTLRLFRMGTKWAVDSADNWRHLNRAMLVAGGNLFTVTPRGVLTVHSTEDGRKLAEMKLETAAWDGLAAANGRLYLSTVSGKVICLGE